MDTQVASPPATSPDESSSKDIPTASEASTKETTATTTKEANPTPDESRKQSFGNMFSGRMFNMGQVAAVVTSKKEPPTQKEQEPQPQQPQPQEPQQSGGRGRFFGMGQVAAAVTSKKEPPTQKEPEPQPQEPQPQQSGRGRFFGMGQVAAAVTKKEASPQQQPQPQQQGGGRFFGFFKRATPQEQHVEKQVNFLLVQFKNYQ